jgi:hypothetical protein
MLFIFTPDTAFAAGSTDNAAPAVSDWGMQSYTDNGEVPQTGRVYYDGKITENSGKVTVNGKTYYGETFKVNVSQSGYLFACLNDYTQSNETCPNDAEEIVLSRTGTSISRTYDYYNTVDAMHVTAGSDVYATVFVKDSSEKLPCSYSAGLSLVTEKPSGRTLSLDSSHAYFTQANVSSQLSVKAARSECISVSAAAYDTYVASSGEENTKYTLTAKVGKKTYSVSGTDKILYLSVKKGQSYKLTVRAPKKYTGHVLAVNFSSQKTTKGGSQAKSAHAVDFSRSSVCSPLNSGKTQWYKIKIPSTYNHKTLELNVYTESVNGKAHISFYNGSLKHKNAVTDKYGLPDGDIGYVAAIKVKPAETYFIKVTSSASTFGALDFEVSNIDQ